MKKLLSLLVVLLAIVTLVACGGEKYEIAMITDTGDIDDGSFNQGTWEGIKDYAKENNKTHKYYKPAGETDTDYLTSIDLAVAGGAKIILTPGFYFEVPVYQAQAKYPNVKFVILDGAPKKSSNDSATVGANTLSIFFKEQEAGFLAGYASVKEGFSKLGFMGGIAVPAVRSFGVGFIAGAYYAAKEKALSDFSFKAENYDYLGTFNPSDAYKSKASSWYSGGVEVIHAAAGGAGSSVMSAAKEASKWVIGVDSDQADDSDSVLTSALKKVGEAAIKALGAFYKDEFPGGMTWRLDVHDKAVGLPMETSRFENFTVAQYNKILKKVEENIIVPNSGTELKTFIEGLDYTVDPQLITKIG
ncbi:predicted basic membrane lipoprotein [Alteracholeplasma palmae J233]|uniref:Predicted basic membrane lipoprotein n=1 Tax=Alteracholeplasma palmae (strain ATCC 49389 / J233) TaxID=1318466 RepID=U4KL32_ALTPJ|nr:BMP family ABC transporter substrate-binding protein [Alteracholeplasma palmae]CCV64428.1 predicted basic membrane lipoprotein [Alteracholeplasma palmae J233]